MITQSDEDSTGEWERKAILEFWGQDRIWILLTDWKSTDLSSLDILL